VPEPLLSGNPSQIEDWRFEEAVHKTSVRRPELLKKEDEPRKD